MLKSIFMAGLVLGLTSGSGSLLAADKPSAEGVSEQSVTAKSSSRAPSKIKIFRWRDENGVSKEEKNKLAEDEVNKFLSSGIKVLSMQQSCCVAETRRESDPWVQIQTSLIILYEEAP